MKNRCLLPAIVTRANTISTLHSQIDLEMQVQAPSVRQAGNSIVLYFFLVVVKNCNRCDPTALHAVCTRQARRLGGCESATDFRESNRTFTPDFSFFEKKSKKVLTFTIQSIYITHSPSIRRGFCSLKN